MNCWADFKQTVAADPQHHRLAPPCTHTRIAKLEAEFGSVPQTVRDALLEFDGAELFIAPAGGGPLCIVLPATRRGSGPAYVEGVDHHTREWRSTRALSAEWIIGVFNYGGYLVVDPQNRIREWDSASQRWSGEAHTAANVVARLLNEGAVYLVED